MAEDITRVRQEGFKVDDDNEPLPENVPTNGNVPLANKGLYEGQSWGWDSIDWQITTGGGNYDGPSFPNRWTPQGIIFEPVPVFFSNGLVLDHPASKDGRSSADIGGQPGPCHF